MARKSPNKQPAAGKSTQPRQTPSPQLTTHCTQSGPSGVLLPAMVSALTLWAASPPLAVGWLAWLAPLGWLWICQREAAIGGRGYVSLWLAGCVFWLLVLHGIRLAYWPLIFGWLALALYLAVYIPIFVAATRVMVWQWKCPLVLAAPTVWLGLELIRSYLLTGFAANTLAHTQVHYPLVIQIADQLGGGGVSWVMMTVAAAIFPAVPSVLRRIYPTFSSHTASVRVAVGGAMWAAVLLSATLGYGWWRLNQADRSLALSQPLLRVLLVQENKPSMFDSYSPERNQQAWDAYLEMTRQGAAEYGPVHLVVWPESTFTGNEPWVEQQLDGGLPDELQREQVDRERLLAWISDLELALPYKANLILTAVRKAAGDAAREQPSNSTWPYLLVGSDVVVYKSSQVERFNSALFISPTGELLERYSKMHLVMFGEYIPLGPLLQWLREMVGLAGIDAGTEVKSFQLGQVRVAPNICFESVMPQVINAQVRQLAAQGESPDVLVNITNDSWFRGSTILDHHLACSMLMAVENRRPVLVAANSGLSAHIDGSGRLLACSRRLVAEALFAEPHADGRWGLVQAVGFPLSWLCGLVTLAAMCWPGWRWLRPGR